MNDEAVCRTAPATPGLLIILPNMTYKRAKEVLNIEPLEARRTELTLRFDKKRKEPTKIKHFFELNPKTHNMKTRLPHTSLYILAQPTGVRNSFYRRSGHVTLNICRSAFEFDENICF